MFSGQSRYVALISNCWRYWSLVIALFRCWRILRCLFRCGGLRISPKITSVYHPHAERGDDKSKFWEVIADHILNAMSFFTW